VKFSRFLEKKIRLAHRRSKTDVSRDFFLLSFYFVILLKKTIIFLFGRRAGEEDRAGCGRLAAAAAPVLAAEAARTQRQLQGHWQTAGQAARGHPGKKLFS